LESLDVGPNSEWKENDVEEPNEDPSARETPSEENSIPDPVKQEIKQHVSKQNHIPRKEGNHNNKHLHPPRNDLEKNSQPSWSGWLNLLVKFLLVNWINASQIINSLTKVVHVTCGILAR